VIQHQGRQTPDGGAFVAGDLAATVEDDQLIRAQQHPDLPADEAGGHGVVALADGDPGVAVYPRRQRQPGLERLHRQRPQQRLLEREVLPTVATRLAMRRWSSAASWAARRAFSSAIEATLGTGTRWVRRNRPPSPSTPPFS